MFTVATLLSVAQKYVIAAAVAAAVTMGSVYLLTSRVLVSTDGIPIYYLCHGCGSTDRGDLRADYRSRTWRCGHCGSSVGRLAEGESEPGAVVIPSP